MAQAICKFPTEWSKAGLEARYSWLKRSHEARTHPLSEQHFNKLMDHARALAFWEDVHDEDFPPPNVCWHFPPMTFIRQFRMCGWFSEREFKQFLPIEVLRQHSTGYYYETVSSLNATGLIIRNHRVPLNIAMRKYLINDPKRIAVFLGNAIQETSWLSSLHENSPDSWYYPWDGRGFLQLTFPANYILYWDYRGRA